MSRCSCTSVIPSSATRAGPVTVLTRGSREAFASRAPRGSVGGDVSSVMGAGAYPVLRAPASMKLVKLGDLDARVTGGSDREGGGDGPVVVLLHGFGAPGDDLVPLGRVLAAPRG